MDKKKKGESKKDKSKKRGNNFLCRELETFYNF